MKFGFDETFEECKEASDRLIDFTVGLSATEMEPLVPRAGSATADQRPMSVDIDAVSSEEFNNDMAKFVMKTSKVPVEELAPETPTEAYNRSLSCVKRLWIRPFRRFRDRSTR